jgi:hypothetical protein
LAVRIQRPSLWGSQLVEDLVKRARGEADVRYVGQIYKRQAPSFPNRRRYRQPLIIGCSVAHFNVTAGTLGCFVEADDGSACILSNNHVLANENNATAGDAILQPGHIDEGKNPADIVARLKSFIPLNVATPNTVDCAIAALEPGIRCDFSSMEGLGKITGSRNDIPDNRAVAKLGRTTGVTRASVTASELDHVVVGYEIGSLTFNQVVEIDGIASLFSDGGDSGSLIVDDQGLAVALLFAGSEQGGTNNRGLTYACYIQNVLTALNIRLKLS